MSERRILNSWKEIASYLGRGVRTVQRWEKMGLPVHRPTGKDHSAVLAFSLELDEWLNRGGLRNSLAIPAQLAFDPTLMQSLLVKAEHLIQRCEALLLRHEDMGRRLSIMADSLKRVSDLQREKSSSHRSEAGAA